MGFDLIDLKEFRRDLHSHPETGFELERTPRLIAEQLSEAGLKVTTGVGHAGIVATLEAGPVETAIGFRADMDALPIGESNTFDHASKVSGKFHGCGHDGHSTILLGAALRLASNPSKLERTIHFIFQPDEENGNGASAMISDGLFERFPMSEIYGLHNMPGLPVGSFATQAGPFCAFEDNFTIEVNGRGGHASMPEKALDPLMPAVDIVGQLQTIVSRSIPPQDHAVVSVTELITDGARNILPSNVKIQGDCRGFTEATSDTIRSRMGEIVNGICLAHGVTGTLTYKNSFQPLINHPSQVLFAARAARSVGEINEGQGRMGFSEDFAEFLLHKPGAFVLFGNGTEGEFAMPLHNPGYDFNDQAIEVGVNFSVSLAQLSY